MRVYHFVQHEHGLENIAKRRVKLATIRDLNDPFELLWLTSKDRAVRTAIRKTKAHLGKIAGLLCFAPDWSNPVMWGHYADRHRGLCLGFDVPDQYLIPVEYVSSRQELTPLTEPAIRSMSIRTKFEHWSYEREIRLFEDITALAPEKGLFFKPFCQELQLREVIIGASSKVRRADILSPLAELSGGVEIKTARLSFQNFSVTEQKNRRLWK
jgi:hypothetical protein